jgi:predicted ribosome quality control (RQC) complex YloA/Tae2 family protein
MQQLDAITLRALAQELQSLLDTAKVSKVQHPSAHEFLITFWGGAARPAQLNLFFIQLNPEAPFCALVPSRHKQDTALHRFEKPTALCMLLRKQLHGASLLAVRTLPGERVLELVFENFNELGNKVRLVLSLELMGKHTNMLLYDEVQGDLLAVAHGVSETMSQYRELAAGLPYAPPPRPPGKRLLDNLTETDFLALLAQKPPEDSLVRFLNGNLAGFGQRLLEDCLADAPDARHLYRRFWMLEHFESPLENLHPAMDSGGERFTLLSAAHPEWQTFESVNEMVGEVFTTYWQKSRIKRQREQLRQVLARHLKKLHQREKELMPGAEDEIEIWQATGDRLLAAVSSREVPERPAAHRGKVQLSRYESGEVWEIDIDPSISWVDNAQTYYRRAKKAKVRRELYRQISATLSAKREYLETLQQMVSQAESLSELSMLETELAQSKALTNEDFFAAYSSENGTIQPQPAKNKAASTKNKFAKQKAGKKSKDRSDKLKTTALTGVVRLLSSDGLEILLGKSGLGNDAIVGKLSRTDDWWLHVHQMPGSHVLVRAGKGDLPNQTLLEAAMLAVHYSTARNSLNVPVVYTQSKFVRKIPQSYPGHVNYRQERTVFITPDEKILRPLLHTSITPVNDD